MCTIISVVCRESIILPFTAATAFNATAAAATRTPINNDYNIAGNTARTNKGIVSVLSNMCFVFANQTSISRSSLSLCISHTNITLLLIAI
jgi:hypothetical protein